MLQTNNIGMDNNQVLIISFWNPTAQAAATGNLHPGAGSSCLQNEGECNISRGKRTPIREFVFKENNRRVSLLQKQQNYTQSLLASLEILVCQSMECHTDHLSSDKKKARKDRSGNHSCKCYISLWSCQLSSCKTT